jgi:hypothetical protein
MPVQQAPRQPTQWQPTPPPIPATVRGVSQEPPPAPKVVLPRPEALGIAKSLNVAPTAAASPQVDWNQIQARMERLGVLSYNKARLPSGGVRVTMTLPGATAPVEAQGATEAAAILVVLQQAEARR